MLTRPEREPHWTSETELYPSLIEQNKTSQSSGSPAVTDDITEQTHCCNPIGHQCPRLNEAKRANQIALKCHLLLCNYSQSGLTFSERLPIATGNTCFLFQPTCSLIIKGKHLSLSLDIVFVVHLILLSSSFLFLFSPLLSSSLMFHFILIVSLLICKFLFNFLLSIF